MIANPFNTLQTIGIGLAAVVLSVAITVGIEEFRISGLRDDLAKVEAKLETCKSNLITARNNVLVCEKGITDQNAAIEQDAATGKADEAAAQAYAEESMRKAKLRIKQATKLGHGPTVMNAWLKGAVQ